MVLPGSDLNHRCLGRSRTLLPLLRHVATGCKHSNHHRHFSDGVPDTNTQNRDARALHLKLDEIIRAIESARNELIDIERLSDDDLETLSKSFEKIRMECECRTRRGNRTNAEHERRSEGTSVESSVD